MLPYLYIDANLRNVTPICPERNRLGIGFDLPFNKLVRVAITQDQAKVLRTVLDDYISSFAGSQSPGSELIPSVSISVPSDGVNV